MERSKPLVLMLVWLAAVSLLWSGCSQPAHRSKDKKASPSAATAKARSRQAGSAKGATSRAAVPDKARRPARPLRSGVHKLRFNQQVDGRRIERIALMHVPKKVKPNHSYPVVFAFHGKGGNARKWVRHLGPLVDAGRMVAVYANGHQAAWNLGTEPSKADDIAFVKMIVKKLKGHRQLDFGKMYAIGTSNGGGLVHRLAMRTTLFRGIAALRSALRTEELPGAETKRLTVFQAHGVEDVICPYDGGYSQKTKHTYLSAEKSAATWAAHNGCGGEPRRKKTAEGNTRFEHVGCKDNTAVVHYRIEGVGHNLRLEAEGGLLERALEAFGI